jgi:hypothetical protein
MARGVKIEVSDEDLRIAVQNSHSWREVMRVLGYATTNGYLGEQLRLRATGLAIDYSHFSHRRHSPWSVEALTTAIRNSTNWAGVAVELGVSPLHYQTLSSIKGHAARLGIETRHLANGRQVELPVPFTSNPDVRYLRQSANCVAMAWFARRGYRVSVPAEPVPYDLIVEADGRLYRIQVKTAIGKDSKSGAPVCRVCRIPRRDGRRIAYDPDDVDFFFIIDGEGNKYIIPLAELGGAVSVSLRTVMHRQVEPA